MPLVVMEEMVSCSQPRKELEMRLQQGGTHVWEGELLDWKVEQEEHQNEGVSSVPYAMNMCLEIKNARCIANMCFAGGALLYG